MKRSTLPIQEFDRHPPALHLVGDGRSRARTGKAVEYEITFDWSCRSADQAAACSLSGFGVANSSAVGTPGNSALSSLFACLL